MPSFLDKLKNLFHNQVPGATIIGDVKFHQCNIPYFTVKMKGCSTLVNINAEDIVENYYNKFNSLDVRNATKIFIKYRNLLQLAFIEKTCAILHNRNDNSYQLLDLSDNKLLGAFDFELIKSEDAFKLGIHFEKTRSEKDRKLYVLSKCNHNLTHLSLVKKDEK